MFMFMFMFMLMFMLMFRSASFCRTTFFRPASKESKGAPLKKRGWRDTNFSENGSDNESALTSPLSPWWLITPQWVSANSNIISLLWLRFRHRSSSSQSVFGRHRQNDYRRNRAPFEELATSGDEMVGY